MADRDRRLLGFQSVFYHSAECLSDIDIAVYQFKELCETADRDRALTDILKKVLKLSKGWETARDHAYAAVDTDNRMRFWLPEGGGPGLLLKCALGTADLESPVGAPRL